MGFYSIFADSPLSAHAGLDLHFLFQLCLGGGGVMTSMRMRLLFSLFFVHVLVRHIGGEAGVWGWGVMTSMHVHANATFVFSFLCSCAGAVHWWGGGGWGGG